MKKVLIIIILSLVTHFLFFGFPAETVFDEVHFGKFISGYFTGEYFFDIHPPLGKLLISGAGFMSGFNPGFSFQSIGNEYSDNFYMWLRLLPLIAGVLLPLIIYFLARELRFSKMASFVAGLFIILENSLLTQSLFILLDSMLLLFGFLGLLLYFIAKRKKSIKYLVLAAISLALSFSIKWTGGSFLALVIILEVIDFLKNKVHVPNSWKYELKHLLILTVVPFLIYLSIFGIHFALLSKSGPGDAFMTPSFQKTLEGGNYTDDESVEKINFLSKFKELNLQMYLANQRLDASHPYSSKWYSWPSMARTVYYWNNEADGKEARIYLLGNPFIYWLSTIGILILFYKTISRVFPSRKDVKTATFLTGGYLLNLLPFIFIGRVMFLYHYFTALIFAILSLVFVIDKIKKEKTKKIIFTTLMALFTISFIYFAPLTYGIPLDADQHAIRIWFSGWR